MALFSALAQLFRTPPRLPSERIALGVHRDQSETWVEAVPPRLLTPLLPITGQSGSGKSVLLTNVLCQLLALPSRPGALVLDIKDDLALAIARVLPAQRRDDVWLADFSDTRFPVAFNPLAAIPAERKTLATLEIVSALMRIFDETGAAPRMNHVLTMAIATLADVPDATLLDLPRLLVDAAFRAEALTHVANPEIAAFWATEWFAIVGAKESLANIQSLLNRLGLFKFPELQNVLGQIRTISLRQAMDEGKVVLVSLPQGLLGEPLANLLAALFVAMAQVAAQSRVALPQQQRTPFYIVADEFQNYDISSFNKLITEGRSMGIACITACQYSEQISPQLRLAIQKNATVQLAARKQLDARYNAHHLIERTFLQQPDDDPNKQALLQALPLLPVRDPEQLNLIQAQSRALLARPRAVVEAERVAQRAQPSIASPVANSDTSPARSPRHGRDLPFAD